MNQDQELFRALIEKRQKMLATMRLQVLQECERADKQFEVLLAAVDFDKLFPKPSEEDKRN